MKIPSAFLSVLEKHTEQPLSRHEAAECSKDEYLGLLKEFGQAVESLRTAVWNIQDEYRECFETKSIRLDDLVATSGHGNVFCSWADGSLKNPRVSEKMMREGRLGQL